MLLTYLKEFLAGQILYLTYAVTIKTSLLLHYYRLFGVVRWYRFILLVAWVIVFLYWIVDVFVAIFECKPVAFYWDMSIKGGTCMDRNAFYRWSGVSNSLIDFLILSLPLPMIWRLGLPRMEKVSLSGIFLLGLVFSDVIWDDISYTIVAASIWTNVEQSKGIICACLSTLRPLLSRVLPTLTGSFGINAGYTRKSNDILLSDLQVENNKSPIPELPWPKREFSGQIAGSFQKMEDEQHVTYAPGESWIKTDISGAFDPDVEALGEGFRKAIVKSQSIEQSYSHAGETVRENKAGMQ
ncbi:MAG: hypothetical protein Q9179_002618 [Wetmoreana sp. 5 TL-2023]